MPNGGPDCCGTCWFNSKNEGGFGHANASAAAPDFCIIRKLDIQEPFYTYCVNHPLRKRFGEKRIQQPLGPVFTFDHDRGRVIWKPSPDTEEIRRELLRLISSIVEKPDDELPEPPYRDDVVIWQLGEFREFRALDDLRRIAAFASTAKSDGHYPRTKASTVAAAQEAIRKITGKAY